MPIPKEIKTKLSAKKFLSAELNLESQEISDKDVAELVKLIRANPKITKLNLRKNKLSNESTVKLASLEQLRELYLSGNSITVDGYAAFLDNTTLTHLPITGGSGAQIKKIRDHIKANACKKSPPVQTKKVTPVVKIKPTIKKELMPIDEESANFLEDHARKSATDGETDFLALSTMFLADLENPTNDNKILLQYAVIVLNHFMHVATHNPVNGYGKTQRRETTGKLQYLRSQNGPTPHPHAALINSLLKMSGEKISGKGYLPINLPMRNFLADVLNADIAANIDAINEIGLKTAKKSLKGLGPILGYCGLRLNNFSSYLLALEHYVDKDPNEDISTQLTTIIKQQLPKKTIPKKQQRLTPEALSKRISEFRTWFKNHPFMKPIHTEVSADLLTERATLIRKINVLTSAHKLKNIKVETAENSTCMVFELYPDFKNPKRNNKNYAEGVTNAIISYFIALLNHNSAKKGLDIISERRQSFGFLRPSISDVGSLRIRLSLGLEPIIFAEIVSDTLKQLDDVLKTYDFTTETNPTVKKCFVVSEKKAGKNITEATGRRILTAMRSDEDKWLAVEKAASLITKADTDAEDNVPKTAFKNFLQQFVIDRIPEYNPENPKKKASYQTNAPVYNYNFKPAAKHDRLSNDMPLPIIFRLLENICNYAQQCLANLPKTTATFTNDLQHSLLHTISLISKFYQRGCHLLNAIDKHEPTKLYNHANNCIENLLEHLISLHGIYDLATNADFDLILNDKKTKKTIHDHPLIKRLSKHQLDNMQQNYQLQSKDLEIFYADSGQQAIVLSILNFATQIANESKDLQKQDILEKVYVSNDSYYEINSFFSNSTDIIHLNAEDKQEASILLLDVKEIATTDFDEFENAKVVILDLSNYPDHSQLQLQDKISDLRNRGIWVVFAESLLKHGQLGLDKYQAGRITCVKPLVKNTKNKVINDELYTDVDETFSKISQAAANPHVARFLSMTYEITHGLSPDFLAVDPKAPNISAEKVSIQAAKEIGMFAKPKIKPKLAAQHQDYGLASGATKKCQQP